MRAVVQRVARASVSSRGASIASYESYEVVGEIGHGLCALVGVTHDDAAANATKLANKLAGLRIFGDDDGVMNRSVVDIAGAVLVVSQFTLYGDTSRGRRPSWAAAATPDVAEPLVDTVVAELRTFGVSVATGRFRTDMRVDLVNDGPVTVIVEA